MNTNASGLRPANALISVVTPVYNERRALAELHTRVASALNKTKTPFELIFVNDGSGDGSAEELDRLAQRDPRIRVVHLARNFGHQAAIHAGLEHARGAAVALLDSDLQDSPEAIPEFIEKWRAGYDVVYAVRTKRKENPVKRFLFAGFHALLARIATTNIPRDAGVFGLIDARVAVEILRMAERDRYFPGLRSWVGFRQCGVEVERAARYDDSPRVSLFGLFRLAKTAIFSFSTLPLSIFSWIGASALLLFMGLSAFSIFCKLFTDLAIPGWTSYILSASFFGALNALGITILGEYIVRIYDQTRARPIYIVDRVVQQAPERQEEDRTSDADYVRLLEQVEQLLAMTRAAQETTAEPAHACAGERS